MKVNVVRIGNSKGIRIPKAILDQCQLSEEAELEVHQNRLVIRPSARPRKGWAEAFQKMHERGEDRLLDEKTLPRTKWDRTEWRW